MPRKRAFGQAFREKLARSLRGGVPQSPRHDTKMYDKVPKRTNLYQKMRGHAADAVAATKQYERVPKYTTVSFGMRELCPRMPSNSEATADAVAVL